MTTQNLRRRVDALEPAIRLGKVHILQPPNGLTGAALDAWEAEATTGVAPNDLVVVVTIVPSSAPPEVMS